MSGRHHSVDLNLFTHWVPVETRYSDLDPQNHVNNAVFFTYFEQARVRFLRALREQALEDKHREGIGGGEAQPASADMGFVVVTASCFYRRPITGLEPVVVGVRCSGASRATLDLEYTICDRPQGRLYATGVTALASVDPASGRPRSLPAWMRLAFDASVQPSDER